MGKSLGQFASDVLRIATGTNSFSPDNFRRQFQEGFARPSLFQFKLKRMPNVFSTNIDQLSPISLGAITSRLPLVDIVSARATTTLNTIENILNDVLGRSSRDLTFKVHKVQLPQRLIESYNISYIGPGKKFPREINNDNFQIEVLSSGTFWEHYMFLSWQAAILDYDKYANEPSYDVAYYDDIITEAELLIFNDAGEQTYKVSFENIWPEGVGGEGFDWAKKDSIISFPVSFNFSTVTVEMTGGTPDLKKYSNIARNVINLNRI